MLLFDALLFTHHNALQDFAGLEAVAVAGNMKHLLRVWNAGVRAVVLRRR
jgi:hypothetical protein